MPRLDAQDLLRLGQTLSQSSIYGEVAEATSRWMPTMWHSSVITMRWGRMPQMKPVGREPAEAAGTEPIKVDAWFVYILRCSDDSFYTGITIDVERRTKQHNAGSASRYTRSRLPVHVEYQEPQATRSSALKPEAEIKAMSRREKEALITRVAQRSR